MWCDFKRSTDNHQYVFMSRKVLMTHKACPIVIVRLSNQGGHFATTPSPTHYCHCAALNLPTYVHCLYVRTYMCGYVFGIGYQQHANYMLYIRIPASVHLYSAVLSVCIPAVYVCTYIRMRLGVCSHNEALVLIISCRPTVQIPSARPLP